MSSDEFVALGSQAASARRCLVIGEVAQAHDGSLGMAHAFIDAIADAGADAVKFQTHLASEESTSREPWRVKFSAQDEDRLAYWRRMEFTEEQWQGLKRHADEKGLVFLSSPFSDRAFQWLHRLGIPAWKVASGELSNRPLIERLAGTRLPILLSTGMSSLSEIDDVVELLKRKRCPMTLLQCTTAYPSAPEQVGLNLIPFFRERYGEPVGLSDHSGTIFPGLAAAVLGAAVVEVHVTLSRQMFGPDVPASVTTAELCSLMEGVRFIERAMANPVDKNASAVGAEPMRAMFTKSVVLRADLGAGTVLRPEHLTVKKPGTGIPAAELSSLCGSRLRRAMVADEALSYADLEPSP